MTSQQFEKTKMVAGAKEWILSFLRRPEAIKYQMLFYMYVSRMEAPVKRRYDQLFAKEHMKPNPRLVWRGYPPLPKFLIWYQWFTTVWLMFVLLRNLNRARVINIIEYLFDPKDLPARCFIPGNFIIHEEFKIISANLMAFFHLQRRFINTFFAKKHMSSYLVVTVQSGKDISEYFRRHQEYMQQVQAGLVRTQASHCSPRRACERASLAKPLSDARMRWARGGKESTDLEDYVVLKYFMCYAVYTQENCVLKLRANRTEEAIRFLQDKIATTTFRVGVIFSVLAVAMTIPIASFILIDKLFLMRYPQCNPLLAALQAEGKLGWISLTIDLHRLFVITFDAIENLVLWLESGLSMTFGLAIGHLISHDMLTCWQSIDKKIRHLRARLVQDQCTIIGDCGNGLVPSDRYCHYIDSRVAPSSNYFTLKRTDRESRISRVKPRPSGCQDSDEQVLELQSEVRDFFEQLNEINEIMSDVLSSISIIWLVLFGVYTYFSHAQDHRSLPPNLQALQASIFILMTLLSLNLLALHRTIKRSHPVLCSIVAHDRSYLRSNFTKIMDLIEDPNLCTYKLFRYIPFSTTTYLSLVGWSFSCFVVIASLNRYNL